MAETIKTELGKVRAIKEIRDVSFNGNQYVGLALTKQIVDRLYDNGIKLVQEQVIDNVEVPRFIVYKRDGDKDTKVATTPSKDKAIELRKTLNDGREEWGLIFDIEDGIWV